jgi:hypothetical protein
MKVSFMAGLIVRIDRPRRERVARAIGQNWQNNLPQDARRRRRPFAFHSQGHHWRVGRSQDSKAANFFHITMLALLKVDGSAGSQRTPLLAGFGEMGNCVRRTAPTEGASCCRAASKAKSQSAHFRVGDAAKAMYNEIQALFIQGHDNVRAARRRGVARTPGPVSTRIAGRDLQP